MAFDTEQFILVLGALFAFGIAYNLLVVWVYQQAHDHGYTAFLVVGGVLVTLAGFAVLAGLETALVAVACFAAAGLPMIAGSVLRQLRTRAQAARDLEAQAQEVLRAQ